MKTAWVVLIISALTDFITTAATGLISAMVESQSGALPSKSTVLVMLLGGLVAGTRTIQQALKATTAMTAELKGQTVEVTTITPTEATTTSPKKAETP